MVVEETAMTYLDADSGSPGFQGVTEISDTGRLAC